MATGSYISHSCRQHQQEDCKLFCKQCRECICFRCIDEEHEDHTFCRLHSAEKDIREELNKFINEGDEKNNENILTLKQLIKEKRENTDIWKAELKEHIDNHADKMIAGINLSREKTQSDLDNMFTDMSDVLKNRQQKVEALSIQVTGMNTQEIKFNNIIDIFMEVKCTIAGIKDCIATTNKPKFIENDAFMSVGQLNSNCSDPSPSFVEVTSLTQAGDFESTKTMETIFEESSSDIIEEASPLVISHHALKNVEKIFATSQDDAWVLAGNTLRKVKSNMMEENVHVEKIDDFEVIDDCILFINSDENLIRKYIPNERTVPFAEVEYFPCCMSVKSGQVFVYIVVKTSKEGNLETRFRHIDVFSGDGVRIYVIEPGRYFNSSLNAQQVIPCSNISYHYCLLKQNESYAKSSLVRVEIMKAGKKPSTDIAIYMDTNATNVKTPIRELKTSNVFVGAIGSCPGTSFVCGGACFDEKGKILVVDQKYKCVYTLDKELKYQETILKNTDFDLTCPMAITVAFNVLWLADEGKLYKFKYDKNIVIKLTCRTSLVILGKIVSALCDNYPQCNVCFLENLNS